MLTGNSLKPFPAVTFYTNPQTGQQLGGTITLQKALPSIQKSYNITGPGSATLTVSGNNVAGTIFTVNAGVGSTISGLTITGGYVSGVGGGVANAGTLTLQNDVLVNNQAVGGSSGGGAIFNSNSATLTLEGVSVMNNSTADLGGGILNYGVFDCRSSSVTNNKANNGWNGNGGGIANLEAVFFNSLCPKEPKNKGPQKGCRHKSLQGKE